MDFELISKLEAYLQRYGYAEVKAAMDAAKSANGSSYGVSFKYFASVLGNRNKPKPKIETKGVEKNVGTATVEYRPPKRDGDEEWQKYKVGITN